MEEKRISPLKAIRLKCLDCSCGSSNEVKLCPVAKCPLYPFREGRDPFRAKIELTQEQKEQRRKSLAVARANQRNLQAKSENATAKGKKPPSRTNRNNPHGEQDERSKYENHNQR